MSSSGDNKNAKKNKKRAEKRAKARVEKIKQDGLAAAGETDEVELIRLQLQKAKEQKDHELAQKLRQKLWIAQDQSAGCAIPDDIQSSIVEEQPTEVKEQQEESSLSPTEKRLRTLRKKLNQIEQIKEKLEQGQTLEKTQLQKLESEKEIIDEINEITDSLATPTTA